MRLLFLGDLVGRAGRTAVIEAASDFDDALMESYLEGEEIDDARIRAAISSS